MNNYININIIYINYPICFITNLYGIITIITIYLIFLFLHRMIVKIYSDILLIFKNTNNKNIYDTDEFNEFNDFNSTMKNKNNNEFILSIDNDNNYKYNDNKKYYFNDFFSSHNIFEIEIENNNMNQNKKKFKFKINDNTDDVWGWFYIIDDEQLK